MIDILFEKSEKLRNEEMCKFMERANNENGIDTSQVYLGYLVDDKTQISEYKLLTDCTVRTPHNLFYFDIISKRAFGIKGGWTGITMTPNRGLCVNSVQPMIEIVNTPRMTLEELFAFIDDYNKEYIIKKLKKVIFIN